MAAGSRARRARQAAHEQAVGQGGRQQGAHELERAVEEVVGQPASDEDLQGLLKEDVALLRERLAKAKAESPSERLVLKRSAPRRAP